MIKPFCLCTALALGAMIGRAARADDPSKPLDFSKPEDVFKQLDKNQDGQLTPDEIPQEHRRLFERLVRKGDKNGDGKLSLDEFVAAVKEGKDNPPLATASGEPKEPRTAAGGETPPNLDELFKRLDKNNDGKVTADEVPEPRRENFKKALERLGKKPEDGLSKEEFGKVMGAMMRRPEGNPPANRPAGAPPSSNDRPGGLASEALFRLLDKNGDGVITEDEMSAAAENLHKFAKDHDGKITREALGLTTAPRGDGSPVVGPLPPRPNSGEFLRRRFKAMDKNGDGKVSRDEAEGMLKERFDEIDTNRDGFIDEAELKQMIEKFITRARPKAEEPPESKGSTAPPMPEKPGVK